MKLEFRLVIVLAALCGTGCSNIVKFAVDKTQPSGFGGLGICYYLGGAGPVGNIGSFDVPRGLRDAGFLGKVEVVPWQGWTHAGDQLNLSRNRDKAAELANDIRSYRRRQPDAPIHIIALSAGTGIATFALEYLPESVRVDNLVYLGCSMSSRYDMTRALRRVQGKLYVLHSPNDVILKNLVFYTGTVDRHAGSDGIAGLEGFIRPGSRYPDTAAQYQKIVNVPYRSEFRDAGYDGGHTAATNKAFVQFYLAPALMDSGRRLVGDRRTTPPTARDTVVTKTPVTSPLVVAAGDATTSAPAASVEDPLRGGATEESGAPADVQAPDGFESTDPHEDPAAQDASGEDDPLPADDAPEEVPAAEQTLPDESDPEVVDAPGDDSELIDR